MSGSHIGDLVHIWAVIPGHEGPSPFANHNNLYNLIDAISEGGSF